MDNKKSIFTKDGVSYLAPFLLITLCFALWGFANDITNPMVKAFSKIFRMSVTDGALVQVAFYGGYFAMAFPAAMFIKRFSYKAGILVGLGLYASGAFLFYPAILLGSYAPFLIAYFIMTCGLSFLETSANPYILSMGDEDTSTRRLNFAQSFNPIGSLAGMFVAMNFIQARLNPLDSASRLNLDPAEFEAVKAQDLSILSSPYIIIGVVVTFVFIIILLYKKMPGTNEGEHKLELGASIKRLLANQRYREGVIAQFFYVGAQITCWTFIIQYGTRIFMAEGMAETEAEVQSQKYNIIAMIIFCASRFICTFLLKYFRPGRLLMSLALAAIVLIGFVIGLKNIYGLYSLVAVSACMSLMFPTIYGIALDKMGDDAKFGAAGLVMAILGGSLLPVFQASIIDLNVIFGHPAVNVSFIVPLICFIVIAAYGFRTSVFPGIKQAAR